MKLIVAMTGASGAIYGIRFLEILKEKNINTHLILSKWAKKTIHLETAYDVDYIENLASKNYCAENLSASISSGSFKTDGMVIIPCSMKTLSAIASGFDHNLIVRAASVTMKEQRKLILLTRESPLTAIYLENMLKLARLGVLIMPPVPAFYFKPNKIEDIINHTIGKLLDCLNISNDLLNRWDNEKTLDTYL